MSSPISFTSGSLSTNGTVKSGQGLLMHAEIDAGNAVFYDGSTSGNRLTAVSSDNRTSLPTPVKFSSGLYVTVSSTASFAVAHYS